MDNAASKFQPYILASPETLNFYNDGTRLVITLYNPWEERLKFKLTTTAPEDYSVSNSRGSVCSKSYIDIVVTLKKVILKPETHYFRLKSFDSSNSLELGKTTLTAALHPGTKPITRDAFHGDDRFKPVTSEDGRQNPPSRNSDSRLGSDFRRHPADLDASTRLGPDYLVLLIAAACVLGLFLPSYDDTASSILPNILRTSHHLKLVLSFVLGMVTMVILRT